MPSACTATDARAYEHLMQPHDGARHGPTILFNKETAMKLSARNQIKGKVVEVRKGATTAHVRIDIGNGVVITSSITNEAVEDLGLAAGDEAIAVVKASDVMVAK